MTQSTTNHQHGQSRRTLNDAIGHLDKMIDGLSEAIPGTIRETLQETVASAVGEGLRAALQELFTSPELLALWRGLSAPLAQPVAQGLPTAPESSLLRSLAAKVGATVLAATRWMTQRVAAAPTTIASGARTAWNRLSLLRQRLAALRPLRRPVLVALTIGGLAAVAAVVAPSWVAATLSGLGGIGFTLAVQLGLWVRRSFDVLATNNAC